jgi:hypothetical protein
MRQECKKTQYRQTKLKKKGFRPNENLKKKVKRKRKEKREEEKERREEEFHHAAHRIHDE